MGAHEHEQREPLVLAAGLKQAPPHVVALRVTFPGVQLPNVEGTISQCPCSS